jgi:hypothetical protein
MSNLRQFAVDEQDQLQREMRELRAMEDAAEKHA